MRRWLAPGGFVVFHIGRSGSSILTDMLNQHPRIECAGEILHGYYGEAGRREAEARGQDPGDAPWFRSRHYPADIGGYIGDYLAPCSLRAVVGFEIKFYHLSQNGLDLAAFLTLARSLHLTRYVVLKRENYLRKVVSSLVGMRTRRMHVDATKSAELQPIRIDPARVGIDSEERPLLRFFRDFDAGFADLAESLPGRPVLELSYERDLQDDPEVGYAKACRFLGLEPVPAQVTLARTTPFPLREVIANFDEVRAHLQGTPYAWMADE